MKESGRIFAVPTYFFIVIMLVLLGVGAVQGRRPAVCGAHADPAPITRRRRARLRVGVFLVLHTFASGGAAVTGVEAISNGVPAFKPPEWKNARDRRS